MSIAGLAVSSGISGWLEFLLLRRSITARIGTTGIAIGTLLRLWGAGVLAGAAGFGVMRVMNPAHQSVRGASALAVFALVYGIVTVALGVPEAKGIAARVLRR